MQLVRNKLIQIFFEIMYECRRIPCNNPNIYTIRLRFLLLIKLPKFLSMLIKLILPHVIVLDHSQHNISSLSLSQSVAISLLTSFILQKVFFETVFHFSIHFHFLPSFFCFSVQRPFPLHSFPSNPINSFI